MREIIMGKEDMLDWMVERGIFTTPDMSELALLELLVKEGFLLRCDTIPHPSDSMNACYTYVTADERGKKLALSSSY